MKMRLRHLRLRSETSIGTFGADIPFQEGLNIIWADNTKGKSTSLQGLLYVLGLERMLSSRRVTPLTYVMTTHLDDPETGKRHNVHESSVWAELENESGKIITVRRGVVTTADPKLVSVFEGPLLTNPLGHYRQQDYFVLDPGAATREAGFHRMLADFIGWTLPTVRRFDGIETRLYLETIFPLIYVEQKVGWSSIPAAFPTFLQIRDVGQRAVEFLLALDTHALELKKQQLELDLRSSKAAWAAKRDEIMSAAEIVNARVEGIPSTPTISAEEIERSFLLVPHDDRWQSLEETASSLRIRIDEIDPIAIPTVKENAPREVAELERLTELLGKKNAHRDSLFRARQTEIAQKHSTEHRISVLQEDLHKNMDAQKLRELGSTITETFISEYCPTCEQPIADTLLVQRVSSKVMPVEDNIKYIKAQLSIFQHLKEQSEKAIEEIDQRFYAATAEVNDMSAAIRALKADLIAPSNSQSVAILEERIRLEGRLQALEDVQHRFEQQKNSLIAIVAEYAALLEEKSKLPADRFTSSDRDKLSKMTSLIRAQLANYGFSTFPVEELDISEDNYRPQKEGFEIGFELSASDAIRLKWAYQLALLELARNEHTNHLGVVIFDEPRQQSTAKISLKQLLKRAADAKAAGQQVIFATSEDRDQLEQFLQDIDCHYLPFDGHILHRLPYPS